MKQLNEEELRKLRLDDSVDWRDISSFQRLNEDFIREFKDKVDWREISIYQKLSEDFIREFRDKVDWVQISDYQKLSEDFIREFKDKVDWVQISVRQKLSEDFIREFKDELDIRCINLYQNLSDEFLEEFKLQRRYIKIVHNCGNSNRRIYRKIETPGLIHIGCFIGTHQEAIDAISKRYDEEERDAYIAKVNECYKD